jgi:hypothetical protein
MRVFNRRNLPGIIIITILIVMAILNPREAQFKDFVIRQLTQHKFPQKDIEEKLQQWKTANYIIFSNYEFEINDSGVPTQGKYLGVLGGFYSLGGYAPDGTE